MLKSSVNVKSCGYNYSLILPTFSLSCNPSLRVVGWLIDYLKKNEGNEGKVTLRRHLADGGAERGKSRRPLFPRRPNMLDISDLLPPSSLPRLLQCTEILYFLIALEVLVAARGSLSVSSDERAAS